MVEAIIAELWRTSPELKAYSMEAPCHAVNPCFSGRKAHAAIRVTSSDVPISYQLCNSVQFPGEAIVIGNVDIDFLVKDSGVPFHSYTLAQAGFGPTAMVTSPPVSVASATQGIRDVTPALVEDHSRRLAAQ